MDSTEPNVVRDLARDAARRKLARIAAGVAGAAIALAAVAVYWIVKSRSDVPELTRESFDEAFARWSQRNPPDYDMEIKVSGPQAGSYRVQVRDGQATALAHDGVELKRQRVFDTWSVPGMFGTIRHDLENVEAVANGTADDSTPRLKLRGQFHPEFGYPERYHRHQWATNTDISWEVTKFRLVEP